MWFPEGSLVGCACPRVCIPTSCRGSGTSPTAVSRQSPDPVRVYSRSGPGIVESSCLSSACFVFALHFCCLTEGDSHDERPNLVTQGDSQEERPNFSRATLRSDPTYQMLISIRACPRRVMRIRISLRSHFGSNSSFREF